MKKLFISLTGCLFLFPSLCFACEPIIPMVMLYSGTTVFSAVFFKSAIGLLIAVAIKCIVFYWKSEFKGFRSILFIVIANVYSTLPGLLLGLTFAVPVALLFLYPILLIPGGNMKNYKYFKKFGKFGNAGVLFLLIILSMFIFGAAMGTQNTSIVGYWILKIIYATLAISISFLISVVCEDGIVSSLYEMKYKTKKSFLEPVIWANATVFFVIMGLGAAVALPKRLASPDFLIGALRFLFSYLGLV